MNRILSFMMGAILGGFIGATVGILLAPASGEEMRSSISSRMDKIRADVSEAAAQRRAELESQLAALRAPKQS